MGSANNPESINLSKPDSKITSLLIAQDTEVKGRDTIYGKLDFVQLVGITTEEFLKVKENRDLVPVLLENLRADYPDLETDMERTKNYI